MTKDGKRQQKSWDSTSCDTYDQLFRSASSNRFSKIYSDDAGVIEQCAEAGCRLATQETSRSCGVAPQSRRDAYGCPTARIPQSGQLRSLVDFRQIRRDVVLETAVLV